MSRAKRIPDADPSASLSQSERRARIKAIDKELIALVERRAELLTAAIQTAPDDAASFLAAKDLDESSSPAAATIAAVFRELNSDVRARVRPTRVAYLGPEFSYSHLAALARFGEATELVPVGAIAAVFQEVESRNSDFGMVPLENSTDGRISDTLDNFARRRVGNGGIQICGEAQLSIHHYLLGCGSRDQVRVVQSKPQALSQCRNWLAMHLPGAEVKEVTSTTAAAQAAQKDPGVAAIASRQAGVHYELSVLAANIEDNPENVTRFAVLGHTPEKRTGDDKTSLMFELSHRPGALADAITVFKRHRINLTWLESFPMSAGERRPEGGYMFFAEFVGHQQDAKVRRAIASLSRKAKRLEVLGSYARQPAIE